MRFILVALGLTMPLFAEDAFQAPGAPKDPKVSIRWDRFYDNEELGAWMAKLAEAYPEFAKVSVVGKSVAGRPIRCIEITSRKNGDAARKPGFYIDGNIHGNEIQGGEAALYTAWYLLENYGRVAKVTELVDERVFYILPTINPDGRDNFIHNPNSADSSRGGLKPWDNDGDGRFDEDPMDDLDGDGNICEMRVKDPHGRWKPDPREPRHMIRCAPDEDGSYRMVDEEGLDNDGDGKINEDGPGGYDPNRNWPSDWQPPYVQYGANDYPFSLPEGRAVGEFWMAHPNIAGYQSYHNAGGMILRSPGQAGAAVPEGDVAVFDVIGRKGEQMLPGYRYMIVWRDLYTVWGGELDWFYFGRGVIGFSNELWTRANMFRAPEKPDQPDEQKFDDLLLQSDAWVDWHPFHHPTYGDIEIGGFKKNFGRTPPSFLLEEECHRNMSFTLYNADQLPLISLDPPEIRPLGDGLFAVRATVRNSRVVPTRSAQDVSFKISAPDRFTIDGSAVTVLSAGTVTDRDFNKVAPQERKPRRILVDTVAGKSAVVVEWILKGKGEFTVTFDSVKGGKVDVKGKLPE